MSNEIKSNMKCPECGRTVNTFDAVCPECGTPIDDTELDEILDPEEDYSDSFEEEYQSMYEDEEEDIPSFRNIHSEEEFKRFDELIAALRSACKEVEKEHIEIKRLYRNREKLKPLVQDAKSLLLPLAGNIYEKHRKHIRGVCWLRHIANMLCRGVPTEWLEEYDEEYFLKVLHWIPLTKEEKEEFIQLFETW